MPSQNDAYPLEWIDEYARRIKDAVFVREEDCLLIKIPNEAHKLNPAGVRTLQRLFAGETILDLWKSHGGTPEIRRDLYAFFIGLKQVLEGCLNEQRLPKAVDSTPFRLGFNALPVLSEVALTYRCNLSCLFCYAGCACRKDPAHPQEMSTAEVRRVLRVIREEAQVPSVSFTGGEPTLRADLVELVEYAARDLGLRVNLITNGTLMSRELAKNLRRAGLTSAQLSLESNEAAVHDALTQMPGSFQKNLDGMAHLRAQGVHVHTNTTLNRLNQDSAVAMPAFIRSLGLKRFSMNLIIPEGSSLSTGRDITLRYSEISDLILAIQAESEKEGVEFMWYSPTPICIFNPVQNRLGNKGCAACDGLLSVSPTGDLLPCSSWPKPVGNLLCQAFRPVWDSVAAQGLRNKNFAPPRCQQCEDFALCQSGCPLYWDHFGYEELESQGGAHVAAVR
jgi:radical SAM protein with 4Fe4S-binding SPASM domain